MWVTVLRVERELVARGYTFKRANGLWRMWTKMGPAPSWAPPQDCLYVEAVEVP